MVIVQSFTRSTLYWSLLSALVALWSCNHSNTHSNIPPLALGVSNIATVYGGNNPKAAYALLSEDAKQKTSFDDFLKSWRNRKNERLALAKTFKQQSQEIDSNPSVKIFAQLDSSPSIFLVQEMNQWRLTSLFSSEKNFLTPESALLFFVSSISNGAFRKALLALSSDRKKQVRHLLGALTSIKKKIDSLYIEYISNDFARIWWEYGYWRFRLSLIRQEKNGWRIEDLRIRPRHTPK